MSTSIDENNILAERESNTIGTWKFYDRDGSIKPLQNARVEIEYLSETTSEWTQIGDEVYTDANGNWSIESFPNIDTMLGFRAITTLDHPEYGRVIDSGNNSYSWYVEFAVDDFGTNLDSWFISAADANHYAAWLFNDIIRTRDALKYYEDPGTSIIKWYVGSTQGNFFRIGDYIYLEEDTPKSEDTSIHELGHNYMYNIFDNWLPTTYCPSPHYTSRLSHTNCALTEGWATFLALYMNDDPVYDWPSGARLDQENTSSYDEGSSVEGRITGALWDMFDNNNDGTDIGNIPFSDIYHALYDNRITNFSEYWDKYKSLGYDQEIVGSLWQNTLYYDLPIDSLQQIEAEHYTLLNEILIQKTTDIGGGLNVQYTVDDYLMFSNVDFHSNEVTNVELRVDYAYDNGFLEMRLDSLDGELISTIDLSSNPDAQEWKTLTAPVSNVSGIHDLYLVFRSSSRFDIMNLNWFTFSTDGSGGTNVLKNDSFETGDLNNWYEWHPQGQTLAAYVKNEPAYFGDYVLVHWADTPYQQLTSQSLNLENGTYKASVWVKSGGGQNALHLFVTGYGGEELQAIVGAESIDNWTQYVIEDIEVTSGAIEVGVWSDSSFPQVWSMFDEFELIKVQ